MGRGLLTFKGETKAKKKKTNAKSDRSSRPETTSSNEKRTSIHDSNSTSAAGPAAASMPLSAAASKHAFDMNEVVTAKIQQGTGLITTSGTVVTGFDTKFQKELSVGDAIIAMVAGQQEMRVVTICLSDTSLNLSSAFSKSLSRPTKYQFIRKPRDKMKESKRQAEKVASQKQQEEKHAFDTYNSTEELVYRERTEHGSYRIKRETVDSRAVSRGDLLEMRAKKTSDKYC